MVSLSLLTIVALAGGTRLDMPVHLHPHPSDTDTCAVVSGADLDAEALQHARQVSDVP